MLGVGSWLDQTQHCSQSTKHMAFAPTMECLDELAAIEGGPNPDT